MHLLKCIMFQSFEVAYYVGFIPIKLLPNDLLIYFDTTSVLVFTLFLFMNASAVLASHYLQVRTSEMQFNAQCLGKWMMY